MSDTNIKTIAIGPYHPLQEEPEFFRLHVDGEIVVKMDVELGYNHRGIEKLSQGMHFDQVPFLVERICGICSTSHPFSYVLAVEDIGGWEIPLRAQYIRTVVAEVERLHSHLLWLGLAGHFLGYNTVWMWAWKAREPLLELFEKLTGNRNHYGMFKVGGVRRDFEDKFCHDLARVLDNLVPVLDMFKGAVSDDPVLRSRMEGVGVLSYDDCRAYGAVGPVARASGLNIDARRDDPIAAYPLVQWRVPVLKAGDIYAKALIRVMEMYESVSIVRQCAHKLLTVRGPVDLRVTDVPPGEGIGHYEAPRGECFHYVMSDGSNRPARHKIRAPSYTNVATDVKAVVGETVSDAALVLAAVDPCYCCTERMIAVDAGTGATRHSGAELVRLCQAKTERLRRGGRA